MRMQGIALVLASFIISIQAYGYSGILYEQNSGKKKQLFTMNVDLGKNEEGQETAKVTYKDNDGNLALEENIILDGSKVIRDEAIQKQLNQVGLMEVKDGKIFFSKTEDGKTSTKEEKLEEPFVTSANFQRFVRDHWEQIIKGDTISFRYGVWDRQETVGFKIFKIGEEKVEDKTIILVKMKPSSFVIAAIVNPIIFKFPADGAHLLEMNGRVPPRQKVGDKFKPLDAEVVYSY
jgi:hypothetical protein